MSLKKVYLFGYSGHALVVADCAETGGFEISGYFDREENSKNILEITYLGSENSTNVKEIVKDNFVFPSIGSNQIRKKLVELYKQENLNQTIIQHDSAYVAKSAQTGLSTLIGPKAVINANAIVGEGAIINTSALIEHECNIGSFSHIGPGSVLAGNVTVGENSFIGANSTIKQGLKIGANSTIGAGSVVLKDIPSNEIWAGVPAKKIKDVE